MLKFGNSSGEGDESLLQCGEQRHSPTHRASKIITFCLLVPGSWARGELLFCDWCMESWQRICWDIPGLTVVTFLVTRPTCHDTLHLVTCRMLHAPHVQTRCYTWFNRDRGGGYKSWYEYQRKISENKHVYNGNFNILASFMVIGMVGIVPIFYQINQICQCWKNLYNIRVVL